MAGAITFNVLVAFLPLLLLVAGIGGYAVSTVYDQPVAELLEFVLGYLPEVQGDVELIERVGQVVEGIVSERAGFSIIGALVLLWISTRLAGTIRTVLRNVFEIEDDRGIVAGKIFDLKVVLLGGLLLILNVGATVGLRALQAWAERTTPGEEILPSILALPGRLLAFLSAWVLFYLLYRYIPARPVVWRTAMVGATFTAVFYELMKEAFAWYVVSIASFATAYGSLAVVAILFFWIYYGSVVFILGGLVSRSYERWREERMRNRNGQGKVGGVSAALVVLLLATSPAGVAAQAFAPPASDGPADGAGLLHVGESVLFGDRTLEREVVVDRPLVEHDGPYVVVHIAESRVFVMEGRRVAWSAPAGTGDGFQLEGQGRQWTFTTPVGMFQVLRREKDPVWIAPDWYYVERGMRIPANSTDRLRVPGTLGTSALFLGDGIAIHGTNQPELLMNRDPDARRVSHGCIRLTNEAARQLYHMVDVGTPVLVY